MKEVLSLGAFVIMLIGLAVFVLTLKPDVVGTVHAPNMSDRNVGHSSAQQCGLNVTSADCLSSCGFLRRALHVRPENHALPRLLCREWRRWTPLPVKDCQVYSAAIGFTAQP
jgi:hypothetical protein